jgi:chromosome segregation ATPase
MVVQVVKFIDEDVRALQEELIELEKKYDSAVRELDQMEDLLDSERQTTAQAQASAKEEKSKIRNLEDINKRLEAECREVRMQLQTQRGRLQTRQSDEEQHRALINQKNSELHRYIEEVQMLSTENSQLASELEEVTTELEVAMQEMEKVQNEFEGAQKALQDSELRIEELVDERDALRIRVEDVSDQLDSLRSQKHSTITLLENQIVSLNENIKEEKKRAGDLEETIDKLKVTVKRLRNNDDQIIVEELKSEICQKDIMIDELKNKLNELQVDFKLLAQDWDRAEQIASRKRESSTGATPTPDSEKMQEKYSILKLRRKEDGEKIKQLISEVAGKEKEIVKLEEKLEKFETGAFGLKDALSEIKLLKAKVLLQEKQIEEMTTNINDLEAQGEDLVEENCALRGQLGLEFTKIDLSNFKNSKMVELEKAKSLILTLKAEIDKLEEERIALKSKVRLQALERGERAIELGLDAADLMAVEEYAEKLRAGSIPTERVSSSRPSLPQLDGLLIQLEKNYIEHTETRERLQQAEERLKKASGELQIFESALMEMSRHFMEAKDQLGDVTKTLPNVELLLAMLQTKQSVHSNPKIKQAFIEVEESLSKTNTQLKKENSNLQSQVARQKAETDHFRSLCDNLRTENLKLKMEIENGDIPVRRPRTAIEIDSNSFGQTSVGFSSVLEQLVDALVVVEEQKLQIVDNNKLLEDYKAKLRPLAIRTRLLYKQFAAEKELHQKQNTELKSQLNTSEQERDQLEQQVKRLQEGLEVLKNNPDALKSLYIDLQRKFIVLESQAMGLARRHESMVTTEKFLNKENDRLKQDLLELDMIARQTIARLSKREKSSKEKIEQLIESNHDSIPLTEYRILENKLRIYIEKTRLLTERERDRLSMSTAYETEASKIQELEQRVQELQTVMFQYQKKANAFDEYVNEVKSNGDYLADSYWRPKNASLQVQIDVLERRVQSAEDQKQQAIDMQSKLKEQLEKVDSMYISSQEEIIQLQEKHLELLNKFEGGATREEFNEQKNMVCNLKTEISKLQSDLDYEKNLTETANSQAVQLNSQLKADQAEKDLLRAAVKELQMMDDEKMLIGKLHQHILSLQKNEIRTNDEMQKLKTKCLRLEKIVVQQENQISSQDQFIFELRMKSKKQIQFLHKTIAHMQNKLSGCVLFEKHERACQMNSRLNDLRKFTQTRLERLEEEKNALEGDLFSFR